MSIEHGLRAAAEIPGTAGPVPSGLATALRNCRLCAVLFAAAATALAAPAVALERGTVIEGVARVIDGDTVEVAGHRVRLNGVAAPERSEPGGAEAASGLLRIVAGRTVRCTLNGERTHGREVGVCRVGDLDVGGAVIAAGLARDCAHFSGGRYAPLEPAAAKSLPLPGYCR